MRSVLLLICFIVAGLPRAGHAQSWIGTPDLAGTQIEQVGSARLRLPPGNWELIGTASGGSSNNSHSGQSKLFMQTEGGKIGALLLLSANTQPLSGYRARWIVPSDCGRVSPRVLIEEDRGIDNYNGRFDCMQVGITNLTIDPESPLWSGLAKRAAETGVLSSHMPYVTYHKSSEAGLDVITVSVLVNPALPSFKQLLDTWPRSPNSVATSDARAADLFASWARTYRKTVADALE